MDNFYTRYGFTRRRHNADKIGDYATAWKGEIVLSSENPEVDEIEAARDFESLVIAGKIPLHGTGWRLANIGFNFNPSTSERAEMGAGITCIVTVGYRSEVKRLPFSEAVDRLAALGILIEEPTE